MDPRRTTSASSSSAVASAFRMMTVALELGHTELSENRSKAKLPLLPWQSAPRAQARAQRRSSGLNPGPHGIDAQRAPHGQQHIALLRGRLRSPYPPSTGQPTQPTSARRMSPGTRLCPKEMLASAQEGKPLTRLLIEKRRSFHEDGGTVFKIEPHFGQRGGAFSACVLPEEMASFWLRSPRLGKGICSHLSLHAPMVLYTMPYYSVVYHTSARPHYTTQHCTTLY